MFQSVRKPRSGLGTALTMMELIYHSVVRSVRKTHNNAFFRHCDERIAGRYLGFTRLPQHNWKPALRRLKR